MDAAKKFEIYSQNNIIVDEAYTAINANFSFSDPDAPKKALAIVSSAPREGKTAIAINLAVKFAQSGSKVLLVDTDLRKPSSAKHLTGDFREGLYAMFVNGMSLEDITVATNIENLFYITSGIKQGNPYALLASKSFDDFLAKAKMLYDLIIFDTPALSSVIDGAVVASKSDQCILVVRAGKSSIPRVARSKEQLEKVNANLIGVILNCVSPAEYRKYYEAYGYYQNDDRFIDKKAALRKKVI